MSVGNLNFVETATGTVPLNDVAIRLHPLDDVAIAKIALQVGTTLLFQENDVPMRVTLRQFVPSGHKVALRNIAADAPLRRYGQIIGFASKDILPGEHVHLHNVGMRDFDRDYAISSDVHPVDYVP